MPTRVAVVLGTRPEIIKLGPLIKLLGESATVIHTGQHYDVQMSEVFFDAIGLRAPEHVLGIGGASRGEQIGRAVSALSQLIASTEFRAVVVQGDTNSAVAGALAANATDVGSVHVESGLRSYDRRMPEEHNRVVADHLCDLLCAPTDDSVSNLLNEAISADRISLTGNTVVDAVHLLLPSPTRRRQMLQDFDLEKDAYVLATIHRPENVDDPHRLSGILLGLKELGKPIVLSIHPRTEQRVEQFDLSHLLEGMQTTSPLGYEEFLGLAAECAFLVSDSGGVQEEASIIKRPVIVVRRSTERPEVQGTFARMVEPEGIVQVAASWLADIGEVHRQLADLDTPYGDGKASQRILMEMHATFG